MKFNYYFYVMFLFLGITAFSQQCNIVNGAINRPDGCNASQFSNCMPEGWGISHGSPSYGTRNGSLCAWLWSYGNSGEGIVTNYNFEKGITYKVSFKMKTSRSQGSGGLDNAKVFFRAVSGLRSYQGAVGSSIPRVPQDSELVYSDLVSNNLNIWQTKTVTFKATKDNSQFWIYPHKKTGGIQGQLEVDDIVITPIVSTNFEFSKFCAKDGTVSIKLEGDDLSSGITHWWRIAETSRTGSISDQDVLTETRILLGRTATFHGLDREKKYFIKHGVYGKPGSCITWRELRKPVKPANVFWANFANDVKVTKFNGDGAKVSVTFKTDENPVFLNNLWQIYYAPNADTSGNTIVPSQPTFCCDSTQVTFSNLEVNKWYYVKRGFWNQCIGWIEIRKLFRVSIGLTESFQKSKINYILETEPVFEKERDLKLSDLRIKKEVTNVYPSYIDYNAFLNIKVLNAKKIKEINVVNLTGNSIKLPYDLVNSETVRVLVNKRIAKGVNMVKVVRTDGSFTINRFVVK